MFVDAEDFPGAVQAAGRYKVDGGKVTVSVTLFEGDKEIAAFTQRGRGEQTRRVGRAGGGRGGEATGEEITWRCRTSMAATGR